MNKEEIVIEKNHNDVPIATVTDVADNILLWIKEASAEIKIEILDDPNKLAHYIEIWRYRLDAITQIYGYQDEIALMLSQYLDTLIVKYQAIKRFKA